MSIGKIIFKCAASLVVLMMFFTPVITARAQADQNSNRFSAENFEVIDDYLENQLNMLGIPGASLVIVKGDQIVHTKGFGTTGPGEAAPTPQTPFFIGSLTKSFTSLAVMQLVESGKIELDAPVQRYLPWFTLADTQASSQITVRHLLNQTSGLSQTTGMIPLADFDSAPDAAERQARGLAAYQPAYPAGSNFDYSNMNFNLLGLIIEAVSGETYADYVQNHIFAPLEMNHSYTSKASARQNGLAVGHQMWFGFPVAVPNLPVPVGSLASGQLISSAEDMGHYLIAQLNDGRYKKVQILSPEGIALMHSPAANVQVAGSKMADYGMGWFIDNQEQIVFHDGEVPDYFAYMALLPEQNYAMALLVNANQQIYNYALWAAAETAAKSLMEIPVQSNAWGVLPWVVRIFSLLPFFQIIAILNTLSKIKYWRLNPNKRPGPLRMWSLHILPSTIFNLVLILTAAGILASGLFNFIMLFMGDIISVLMLSGVIALVWFVIRTYLIFKKIPYTSSASNTDKR